MVAPAPQPGVGRRGTAGSSNNHGHEQVLIKKGSGGATALDTSTAESSYGDETTENTASLGKDLARAPEVRRGVSPVGPEVLQDNNNNPETGSSTERGAMSGGVLVLATRVAAGKNGRQNIPLRGSPSESAPLSCLPSEDAGDATVSGPESSSLSLSSSSASSAEVCGHSSAAARRLDGEGEC